MSRTKAQSLSGMGIDIGKNTFHVVGMDDKGNILIRRCFTRVKLICSGQQKLATALEFFQNNLSDSFGVRPPLY